MGSLTKLSAAAVVCGLLASISGEGSSIAQPARREPPPAPSRAPAPGPAAPDAPVSVGAPPGAAPISQPVTLPRFGGLRPEGEEKSSDRCRRAALLTLRKARLAQRKPSGDPATASLSEQEEADVKWLEGMHLECLDSRTGLTSGTLDIGSEVLRSVAQVILKRAERAGWVLLRDTIREGARCDDPPSTSPGQAAPTFPKTCRTLGTLDIRDLVSSPGVLVDALVADLLAYIADSKARPFAIPPLLDQALTEASSRFPQSDLQGIVSGLRHVLGRAVRDALSRPSCDRAAPEKALWLIGMCLVEVQNPSFYDTCDVNGWVDLCVPSPSDAASSGRGAGAISMNELALPEAPPQGGLTEAEAARVRADIFRIWSLGFKAIATRQPSLIDLVNMTFAMVDLAVSREDTDEARAAREYTDALRGFFLGIAASDWIGATSGAVRVARLMGRSRAACSGAPESEACVAARADDQRTERLLAVMAAVGSYAATFGKGAGDPAAASVAREKIIEDLVDRMVNRTDRTTGAVVSLGGNVGLFGGARTNLKGSYDVAFPLELGLGVGVQTYHEGRGGFHAQLSAFDLGQYVTLGAGDLKVESPSISSAVSLGLTLGGWIGLRETPFYVGVHAGMSPFVKANEKLTYTIGAATGIYVPLLDLN